MNDDDEIGRWFEQDLPPENELEQQDTLKQVLARTKTANAQRDTMDLVFVKIWAAMAVLLAPLFAGLGKQQAQVVASKLSNTPKIVNSSSDSDSKDKSQNSQIDTNKNHSANNGEQPAC